MSDYLTAAGLNIPTLAEIKAAREASYRSAFGAGIKTGPDSVFGKLISIESDNELTIWELAQAVYSSHYPNSASGVHLDEILSHTVIVRNPAIASKTTVYLSGTPTTIISQGSLIEVQNSQEQFETVDDITLIGNGEIDITSLTNDGSSLATVISVGVHGMSSGNFVFIYDADQEEYNGLHQVTVLDTTTFTYIGSFSGVTTPATGSPKMNQATAGEAESIKTGAIQALAGTLNIIVNSLTGWDRVSNFLDATEGQDQETDAAARVRREASLEGLGGARLAAIRGSLLTLTSVTVAKVFENATGTIDSLGRPGHTIEALVIGGDDQEIFDTVFDRKAGGIGTYGTETGTATDEEGTNHTVYFSRPIDVLIYLEVDLTTNTEFPVDGTAQVEAAILEWGDTLEIGQDVIVYPQLIGSFDHIPGITDVVIRIDDAAGPTTDDNILIAETSIAKFDSSRTTVTEL